MGSLPVSEQIELLKQGKVNLPRHHEVRLQGAGVILFDHGDDWGWRLRNVPVINKLVKPRELPSEGGGIK